MWRELEVGADDARDQPGRLADRDGGELGSEVVRGHGQHVRRRPNTVAVSIAPKNGAAIAAALAARTDANGNVTKGSSTPTRAAENAAVTYLTGLTAPTRSSSCWPPTASRTVPPAATGRTTTRPAPSPRWRPRGPPASRRSSSASRPAGAAHDGSEDDGRRGRLSAAASRAILPGHEHGRVRGGAADAGRDGEHLHVLRPAAADERRHDHPREHRRQGQRPAAPSSTFRSTRPTAGRTRMPT